MVVVKMITDDDGCQQDNKKWHYISTWGDAHRLLCDGQVFGEGESSAQFITKVGKVTCDKCKDIIRELKSVKL